MSDTGGPHGPAEDPGVLAAAVSRPAPRRTITDEVKSLNAMLMIMVQDFQIRIARAKRARDIEFVFFLDVNLLFFDDIRWMLFFSDTPEQIRQRPRTRLELLRQNFPGQGAIL